MRDLLLATGLIVSTAPALARDTYVYGPRPDWARYRQLGEAALRTKLPEPANWSIEWPNGYIATGWRHKGTFRGYLTCGVLHAIAPVNGLYPRVNFAMVIDHDQVQIADISQKMSNSLVNVICGALVSRGIMPPASLMESGPAATAPAPPPSTIPAAATLPSSLGLDLRSMPEGAYVTAVAAGSPAARAGLVPGMVIVSVNGVALARLGTATTKIVEAAGPGAELSLIDGRTVKLNAGR